MDCVPCVLIFSVEQKSFHSLSNSINPSPTVPSRHTVRRMILQKHINLCQPLRSFLAASAQSVCLTRNAGSLRAYRGYILITVHFIGNAWNMRSFLWDYARFSTPHTRDSSFGLLYDIIKMWKLETMIYSIKTYNALDIVKNVKLLQRALYGVPSLDQYQSRASFLMCVALYMCSTLP